MSEQKITYITTPAEIRAFMNMALDAGLQPNASGLHVVSEEFLIKQCKVPLENIMKVTDVIVTEGENNGMPKEIVLKWNRIPRVSAAPTPAQESAWNREQADYIVAEVVKRFQQRSPRLDPAMAAPYGLSLMPRMTLEDALRITRPQPKSKPLTEADFADLDLKRLADVTPEEWEAKCNQAATAESAVTSLQIQLAEAQRRHAEDKTEHDGELAKLARQESLHRAEIRTLRDSYRHAPKSASPRAAWAEVYATDRKTARWIIASAYKLFNVPAPVNGWYLDYLRAEKDLPLAALHYIHGMSDNFLQVAAPQPVTMQLLKAELTALIQSHGHDAARGIVKSVGGRDKLPDVPEMLWEDMLEAIYKAKAEKPEDYI